jgi:hypothetical protein
MKQSEKPVVVITGAAGNIGRSLVAMLAGEFRVVGLDRNGSDGEVPVIPADFTNSASVELALMRMREHFGSRIASVVHLVAYYDVSGEEDARYRSVNVEGARHLLRALQTFEVQQFIYASTTLVHAPRRPGERVRESDPIAPRWAYPRSKAEAEAVMWEQRGDIPCVSLRLAGVYDRKTVVPTMAQQIARVYESSRGDRHGGHGGAVSLPHHECGGACVGLAARLIFGFAVCLKPEPGTAPHAAMQRMDVPPGWTYNPSACQRVPIIAMALFGLFVSRYLAGYQLEHLPTVWDPFFAGSPLDPRNGTEEVITSHVSKAWPVSDAAVGGYTYLMEIVTALVGAKARWRTMPWLVVAFGLMIAPLGVISIFFIIIQPIVIGTWSVIALAGAGAVLIRIPYSLDEIIATMQFMRRRVAAGRNAMRVFFRGDIDEAPGGQDSIAGDEFARPAGVVIKDMFTGGVTLPWNLALAAAVGLGLMFTRPLFAVDGGLAHMHHVVGALTMTVVSISCAEVARTARLLIVPLGVTVAASPFVFPSSLAGTAVSLLAGLALMVLSIRRGPVLQRYAGFDRYIF